MNSTQLWNLVRCIRNNNTGGMYAFTAKTDPQFFNEHDIKEQTAIYY